MTTNKNQMSLFKIMSLLFFFTIIIILYFIKKKLQFVYINIRIISKFLAQIISEA